MVNLKSSLVMFASIMLLIAVIGLVSFGIDWWRYTHSSNARAAIALNYAGLRLGAAGLIGFVIYLVPYLYMKD